MGSYNVGFTSRVTIHIRGLITLLITTHDPPSKSFRRRIYFMEFTEFRVWQVGCVFGKYSFGHWDWAESYEDTRTRLATIRLLQL